jgi:hypothetical protein
MKKLIVLLASLASLAIPVAANATVYTYDGATFTYGAESVYASVTIDPANSPVTWGYNSGSVQVLSAWHNVSGITSSDWWKNGWFVQMEYKTCSTCTYQPVANPPGYVGWQNGHVGPSNSSEWQSTTFVSNCSGYEGMYTVRFHFFAGAAPDNSHWLNDEVPAKYTTYYYVPSTNQCSHHNGAS